MPLKMTEFDMAAMELTSKDQPLSPSKARVAGPSKAGRVN